MDSVTKKAVTDAIRALNASGFVDPPIKVGRAKLSELVERFVIAIEDCSKNGVLEEIPDESFAFYEMVVDQNMVSGSELSVDDDNTELSVDDEPSTESFISKTKCKGFGLRASSKQLTLGFE